MFLSACTNGDSQIEQNTGQTEESLDTTEKTMEVKTVATNLNEPWEIVKTDDAIFISERDGSIVEVTREDTKRKPVDFDQDLAGRPEAGLLGLAFPDSYEKEGDILAYYSYIDGQDVFQRVATMKEEAEQWIETGVIIDRIPGGQYHQGGRIEIGPDNKLYITTGDATEPVLAQDQQSLAGKILRINLDGSIPEDNPIKGSPIYTLGHRNPQGLAWDEEGNLYATEHGNRAHDEINFIQPRNNYGWPEIEGDDTEEGLIEPVIHSGDNTWAPTGADFYQDHLYFASLRGESIRRFNPDGQIQEVVLDGYGRIRDVLATEEGLYFITNNTDGRGNPSADDDRLLFIKFNNE